MIRKLLVAAALGGLVLASAACNTVKGAGQDLESASTSVEKEM